MPLRNLREGKCSATFRIPVPLFKQLKRMAINEDLTYSVVAERLLRAGLRLERETRTEEETPDS